MVRRILFADNNADFLETRASFLRDEGYEVHAAVSPDDARQKLADNWYHVAILDNRLVNDHDPSDSSGYWLAQEPCVAQIPRIILTAYETDLENPLLGFVPPNIQIVRKQEKPDHMVQRVADLFSTQVRINWNLEIISHNNEITAGRLLQQIAGNDNPPHRIERIEELEDLLRTAFYEKDTLAYRQLLWHRAGRLALVVSAAGKNNVPEQFLVTIGERAMIRQEASKYRTYAPTRLGDMGTTLEASYETLHFAANIYSMVSGSEEEIQPFEELHRSDRARLLATIQTLVNKTLTDWHRNERSPNDKARDQIYRECLHLGVGEASCNGLKERLRMLADESERVGWRFQWDGDHLLVKQDREERRYANPLSLILGSDESPQREWTINTPGILTGDNVAFSAGTNPRAWVTDFIESGPAPLLWNFTSLEAIVRFDWFDATEPSAIIDFERRLTDRQAFGRLDPNEGAMELRHCLRAIHEIRSLAVPAVNRETSTYHRGMFFHAARRLAEFDPLARLERKRLSRFAHLLLATAMLATNPHQNGEESGLQLESSERGVRVDGKLIALTPTKYKLLELLFKRGGLCTLDEIIQYTYPDENWGSGARSALANRVRKEVSELRDKIGHEYIETISGGYRIALPKENR
jgi:DNA-binding response OmpR family regulator